MGKSLVIAVKSSTKRNNKTRSCTWAKRIYVWQLLSSCRAPLTHRNSYYASEGSPGVPREVVRTVAAPPSIVVKWGGWFFVWSFVVLFLSCVCVCDLFLFLHSLFTPESQPPTAFPVLYYNPIHTLCSIQIIMMTIQIKRIPVVASIVVIIIRRSSIKTIIMIGVRARAYQR